METIKTLTSNMCFALARYELALYFPSVDRRLLIAVLIKPRQKTVQIILPWAYKFYQINPFLPAG